MLQRPLDHGLLMVTDTILITDRQRGQSHCVDVGLFVVCLSVKLTFRQLGGKRVYLYT